MSSYQRYYDEFFHMQGEPPPPPPPPEPPPPPPPQSEGADPAKPEDPQGQNVQ